ncbi:MAG: hypothetical protein ACM31L_18810 [Actinomycetota bacterium]
MRRSALLLMVLVALAAAAPSIAADGVPGHIEAARQAYQKGDSARTARELQAALAELQDRLGKGLADYLPPALAGWQAEAPEIQGLNEVGGGLSVSRAFLRNDASLNASLILDSPAVAAAAALFTNPAAAAAQPNLRPVKIGGEDALLRWDPANKAGEVTMVLGGRVLLQIEGDNLAQSETLLDAAKGWNIAGIRKLVGI